MKGLADFSYKLIDLLLVGLMWYFAFAGLHQGGFLGGTGGFEDPVLWVGFFLLPLIWHFINVLSDQYRNVYRLSRWTVAVNTVASAVILTLVIFASAYFLDQGVMTPGILGFFFDFLLLFLAVVITYRMIALTIASNRLRDGKVGFNTVIIGGDQKALDLYREIRSYGYSLGHRFIGFVELNGGGGHELRGHLEPLGDIGRLREILEEHEVEEVLIAIESTEHDKLKNILDVLFEFGDRIIIRTIPDTYDILLGSVKMNHLYGAVLIEINKDIMPSWQRLVKRMLDLAVSLAFLILFSPLILLIMLRTYLANKGRVFYSQERIGLYGKAFDIYKFQSMIDGAEAGGPQLSSDDDPRITPWGRFMRKWRLDEIPQFFNVLKGDMSLVGPRPERKYFIDRIVERAPHYKHLLKVRPGITSWGQVKFGYASSVEEMIQRLKYDILYVENRSLGLDFKIIFYTLLVLLQGKGK